MRSSVRAISSTARRMASSATSVEGKAGKTQPKDMAHHLTPRVRNQAPSAMKAYGALADSKPGLTSLAGGNGCGRFGADNRTSGSSVSVCSSSLTASRLLPSATCPVYPSFLFHSDRCPPGDGRPLGGAASGQVGRWPGSSRSHGPEDCAAVWPDEVVPAAR